MPLCLRVPVCVCVCVRVWWYFVQYLYSDYLNSNCLLIFYFIYNLFLYFIYIYISPVVFEMFFFFMALRCIWVIFFYFFLADASPIRRPACWLQCISSVQDIYICIKRSSVYLACRAWSVYPYFPSIVSVKSSYYQPSVCSSCTRLTSSVLTKKKKMWAMHDVNDEPFKPKGSLYLPVWVQNCPGSEGTGPP